jgi:hypothetical protein
MANPFYLNADEPLFEPHCFEVTVSITLRLPLYIQPEVFEVVPASTEPSSPGHPLTLGTEMSRSPCHLHPLDQTTTNLTGQAFPVIHPGDIAVIAIDSLNISEIAKSRPTLANAVL